MENIKYNLEELKNINDKLLLSFEDYFSGSDNGIIENEELNIIFKLFIDQIKNYEFQKNIQNKINNLLINLNDNGIDNLFLFFKYNKGEKLIKNMLKNNFTIIYDYLKNNNFIDEGLGLFKFILIDYLIKISKGYDYTYNKKFYIFKNSTKNYYIYDYENKILYYQELKIKIFYSYFIGKINFENNIYGLDYNGNLVLKSLNNFITLKKDLEIEIDFLEKFKEFISKENNKDILIIDYDFLNEESIVLYTKVLFSNLLFYYGEKEILFSLNNIPNYIYNEFKEKFGKNFYENENFLIIFYYINNDLFINVFDKINKNFINKDDLYFNNNLKLLFIQVNNIFFKYDLINGELFDFLKNNEINFYKKINEFNSIYNKNINILDGILILNGINIYNVNYLNKFFNIFNQNKNLDIELKFIKRNGEKEIFELDKKLSFDLYFNKKGLDFGYNKVRNINKNFIKNGDDFLFYIGNSKFIFNLYLDGINNYNNEKYDDSSINSIINNLFGFKNLNLFFKIENSFNFLNRNEIIKKTIEKGFNINISNQEIISKYEFYYIGNNNFLFYIKHRVGFYDLLVINLSDDNKSNLFKGNNSLNLRYLNNYEDENYNLSKSGEINLLFDNQIGGKFIKYNGFFNKYIDINNEKLNEIDIYFKNISDYEKSLFNGIILGENAYLNKLKENILNFEDLIEIFNLYSKNILFKTIDSVNNALITFELNKERVNNEIIEIENEIILNNNEYKNFTKQLIEDDLIINNDLDNNKEGILKNINNSFNKIKDLFDKKRELGVNIDNITIDFYKKNLFITKTNLNTIELFINKLNLLKSNNKEIIDNKNYISIYNSLLNNKKILERIFDKYLKG